MAMMVMMVMNKVEKLITNDEEKRQCAIQKLNVEKNIICCNGSRAIICNLSDTNDYHENIKGISI